MSSPAPICPVCESDDFAQKRRQHGVTMGICNGCGLAYTDPLSAGGHEVSGADSSRTAAGFYANLVRNYEINSAVASAKVPVMLGYWTSVFGKRPGGILEIGCGTGVYFRGFQKLGIHWTGAEVNPSMLEFCRSRGMPVVDDMTRAPQSDVVFASQVFEHVLNPREFLSSVKDRLVPGGLLHIDVPNHASLASGVKKVVRSSGYGAIEPPHHLIAYSPPVLRRLLAEEGFDIVYVGAHANDHPVFGQPARHPFKSWLQFRAADLLGRGSLLVGVARKVH